MDSVCVEIRYSYIQAFYILRVGKNLIVESGIWPCRCKREA